MQAIIAGQMIYVKTVGIADEGTILVGADCLVAKDPRPVFANADWDVGVTVGVYSPGGLNNGAVYLAPGKQDKALLFYELAHMNCRPEWPGDQEAVRSVAMPLQKPVSIGERHGVRLCYFDMDTHNIPPACPEDVGALSAYVVHFKGNRKSFMAAFAKLQLGIDRPFVVA